MSLSWLTTAEWLTLRLTNTCWCLVVEYSFSIHDFISYNTSPCGITNREIKKISSITCISGHSSQSIVWHTVRSICNDSITNVWKGRTLNGCMVWKGHNESWLVWFLVWVNSNVSFKFFMVFTDCMHVCILKAIFGWVANFAAETCCNSDSYCYWQTFRLCIWTHDHSLEPGQ